MATQAEVAEAFARGRDAPNVASNYRRHKPDGTEYEYLCGGRNGERIVIAVKDPMGGITVHDGLEFRNDSGMYYSDVRHQQRRTRNFIRQSLADYYDTSPPLPDEIFSISPVDSPHVDDIPALDL